jgi:SpoVK/Ycf46/Vps4 family AAA+-type ATPase
MSNKRNNPTQINNYNKFLKTLDNESSKKNKLEEIRKQMPDEESIQKNINELIEQINTNFNLNYMSSSHFTGQNKEDNFAHIIDTNDPNIYIDYLNKDLNKKIYKKHVSAPKKSPELKKEEPIILQTIHIDTEIKNISDILQLIDAHKIDPSIKYNINMNLLHDIKEPLKELNNMIGMKDLKNNIVEQIIYFIQELHKNKDSSGEYLHTVIYGPPGTGKTEIAKIMGKIYSKIGILSKGTFKKVTRSDLIAGYLGQTALKTREVIKESLGGVLFIDEAYSLGNPEKKDSFSKECIDTLCESLSDNKENLMVIIAGYEKELNECFFSFNQGLDSRFTWRFKTDEYTYIDLYNIFLKKIKDVGWQIHENSNISSDWFKTKKEYFKFYGRDIETLLSKIKIAHGKRVFCLPDTEKKKITLKDLDNGFEVYLRNDNIKNSKEEEERRRYLYSTFYS